MSRLLEPFLDSAAAPAWRARLWRVLLLGAPVAFFAALWLQRTLTPDPSARIPLRSSDAILISREVAAERGLNTDGWREMAHLIGKPMEHAYNEREARKSGSVPKTFLPRFVTLVRMISPDGKSWWSTTFAPDGRLLSFEIGGEAGRLGMAVGSEASERAFAEKTARATLHLRSDMALGDPEVKSQEEVTGSTGRIFTWRRVPMRMPDLEFAVTATVSGGHVTQAAVNADFSDAFLERDFRPVAARRQLLTTVGLLFLAACVLYSLYRYSRRAQNKEIAHGRAALLFGFLLLFGILIAVMDPWFSVAEVPIDALAGPLGFIFRVVVVLILGVEGALLGIAYASGEGDIREAYPGKLTSLDAAVTGRLLTSNAGAAVVTGVCVAMWLLAGYYGVRHLTGGGALGGAVTRQISVSYGQLPWVLLLLTLPTTAILSSVAGLLIPVAFLWRNARREFRIPLLLILSFLGTNAADLTKLADAKHWPEAIFATAAILIPFFLLDSLASFISLTSFLFVAVLGELASMMPLWQDWAPWLSAIALVTLIPFLWAAWRGPRLEDSDVSPAAGRNLAQRLSLLAELSAAREAQTRLLPRSVPVLAGLTISAECTPAREVSGDYYDFFALPGGRLGLVVAEGGNDGLASALTIALAKGFLQAELEWHPSPAETLSRLEEVLGAMLVRESGRTSVAYAEIDPDTGWIRMAHTGVYPRFTVLDSSGSAWTMNPEQEREAAVQLAPGDALVIYTDGLPGRLRQRKLGTPEEALRRLAAWNSGGSAETLHDELRKALGTAGGAADLADDLTTIVLRLESRSRAMLEGAA